MEVFPIRLFVCCHSVAIQKDTAERIDWLDQIKLSHGSVEENALMIAKAINKTAKFQVGNVWPQEDVALVRKFELVW